MLTREALAGVGERIHPCGAGGMAELSKRCEREKNAAVALRLAIAHHCARRRSPALFVVRKLVEKTLDVRGRSKSRQNATLSRRPTHSLRLAEPAQR